MMTAASLLFDLLLEMISKSLGEGVYPVSKCYLYINHTMTYIPCNDRIVLLQKLPFQ